jgi:hypothetical protein
MPGGETFFPPEQYSPVWMLLGLGILAVVVVWFVLVPVLTRAKPVASVVAEREAQVLALRRRFVTLIDQVDAAYRRGETTRREAHQRLSATVRAFAHEASGYPATAMTLSELRQVDLPSLTAAVERFYPAEFGAARDHPGTVADAVAEAKRVVLEWR